LIENVKILLSIFRFSDSSKKGKKVTKEINGKKMNKYYKVCAIDAEGIFVTNKKNSSNNYKYTTCYIKKVALVWLTMFDNKVIYQQNRSWILNLPNKKDVSKNILNQWDCSKKYHGLEWDAKGENFEDVLKNIQEIIQNGIIFVKGQTIERRLLNNLGMIGEYGIHRELILDSTYKLYDLNNFFVQKYDDMFMQKNKILIKPIHNPELECEYFLSERCKLIKNKVIKL